MVELFLSDDFSLGHYELYNGKRLLEVQTHICGRCIRPCDVLLTTDLVLFLIHCSYKLCYPITFLSLP